MTIGFATLRTIALELPCSIHYDSRNTAPNPIQLTTVESLALTTHAADWGDATASASKTRQQGLLETPTANVYIKHIRAFNEHVLGLA